MGCRSYLNIFPALLACTVWGGYTIVSRRIEILGIHFRYGVCGDESAFPRDY